MGKVCKKCSHENRDGAIYCESCNEMLSILGKSVSHESETIKVEQREQSKQPEEPSKISQGSPVYKSITEGNGSNEPGIKRSSDQKKKNGCLTCAVVGLIVLALIFIGIPVGAYLYIQGCLDEYAVTEPIKITPHKSSERVTDKVSSKIERFINGKAKIINLSADELNTYVASKEHLAKNLYFHLNRDLLRIKYNIPIAIFEDRYLSGRIDIKANTSNGKPNVKVTNILLEKGSLSVDEIKELRQLNLFKSINEVGLIDLSKVKSIDIRNNKIQVILK